MCQYTYTCTCMYLYSIIILCLYVHIYMHIFTMYKCNFKYKIPLSDGWGLLDQVVGVVVLPGEELLMCQGTVPRLD